MAADGPLDKQLELLFEGYGYRRYGDPARARKDDQIIRERAAESLSVAADHLARLGQAFARERIAPSTRDQPFPPAERLAEHRQILALKDAFSGVAAWIRALPFPDARTSRGLDVALLLQFDAKLLDVAGKLGEAIGRVELAHWSGSLACDLESQLRAAEQVAKERQALMTNRALP